MDAETFKAFFDRGQFAYGETLPGIRNVDIDRAIAEMNAILNPDIYPSEEIKTQAELYLTAHFLQNDTDASDNGGGSVLLQTSRSALGVSESVQVPEWMQKGDFSLYATTYYGQKFLMLTRPYLGGAVVSVPGGTNP